MFAATPKWRDRLDARTVVCVAAVALSVFALEMAFLARTVASPLGGMIADLERVPQVDVGPVRAYAERLPLRPDGGLALVPYARLPDDLEKVCVAYR